MILNETELEAWGERIGREVQLPLFIGLQGQLGAGKSVLARAIARGAGVDGILPSPTFNLLFRYAAREGEAAVVHMDLYRIRDPEELWELGWEDLGAGAELVLVEWPERGGSYLPEDRWEIELSVDASDPRLRAVAVHRIGTPPHLPGFPVRVDQDAR
jgi:tRNA threonylcarbamoyladenosine biosynthesis protein TsaE